MNGDGPAAEFLYGGADIFCGGAFPSVVDGDVATGSGESQGDGFTDTAAGSGD